MTNFPCIQISCVQVNCGPRKLHDLPVFVTVFDILDLSQLPAPRISVLIFLQVKSINMRVKYKIFHEEIPTYLCYRQYSTLYFAPSPRLTEKLQ